MREDDDEAAKDEDEDGTGTGCVVYPEKADAFETRKLRFERYQKEEALRRFRLLKVVVVVTLRKGVSSKTKKKRLY